jgi:hypothetical protein
MMITVMTLIQLAILKPFPIKWWLIEFFSTLTAGGEIVCQIKRGCKLTCGAPHPPLSGSPCLLIVMLITLQLLLFSANSSQGGIFVQSIQGRCISIATRKGREKEWNAYLYYDASRSRLNNLSSLSLTPS